MTFHKNAMKKKIKFPTELAYVAGIILVMTGMAFFVLADLGVTAPTSPAYVLYLKLEPYLTWLTYGQALYLYEAILLVILCLIVRRFRISYIFSFITAFIGGNILDLVSVPILKLPADTIALRLVYLAVGLAICTLGITFMFHTYISQEVFDLLVKEIARKFHKEDFSIKRIYDISSTVLGLVLMTAFFGIWPLRGIGLGTIICALFNGTIIGLHTRWLERIFVFEDALPLRKYFLDPEDEL